MRIAGPVGFVPPVGINAHAREGLGITPWGGRARSGGGCLHPPSLAFFSFLSRVWESVSHETDIAQRDRNTLRALRDPNGWPPTPSPPRAYTN